MNGVDLNTFQLINPNFRVGQLSIFAKNKVVFILYFEWKYIINIFCQLLLSGTVYPQQISNLVNKVHPANLSTTWGISGEIFCFLIVHLHLSVMLNCYILGSVRLSFSFLSHDLFTLPNRFSSPDSYLGHQCAGTTIVLPCDSFWLILTIVRSFWSDWLPLTPTESLWLLRSILGLSLTPLDSYDSLFSVLGRLVMVSTILYISWLISEVRP